MKREFVLVIGILVFAACGGGSAPVITATTVATTSTQASTTTLPPTTVVAPTDGLPGRYPPELVPPGVTSSYWEPTGAGTDVFFETSAGFEEVIDFFTECPRTTFGLEDRGRSRPGYLGLQARRRTHRGNPRVGLRRRPHQGLGAVLVSGPWSGLGVICRVYL